jgi:hypothetical protein
MSFENQGAEPPQQEREQAAAEASSLDTNHDGLVTMTEINPPRPEDGHDFVNVGIGGGVLLLAVAGAVAIRARMNMRRGPSS